MDENRNNLLLARRYLEMEHFSQALDTLNYLPETLLTDPEHWLIRGHALHGLKDYEKAADAAKSGLSYYSENPRLLYLHCICQERLHNLETAEKAILILLGMDPENPDYLCQYALMVAEVGQLDKAESLVEEAARIAPDFPWVLEMRVMLAHLRCKNKKVTRLSRDLLAFDPENRYGHIMLAGNLWDTGKLANAAPHYQTAIQMDPNDKDVAKFARKSRVEAHWLLWPVRPFSRTIGIFCLFLFMLLAPLTLMMLGLDKVAPYTVLLVFIILIYGSIMPSILKWWFKRRYP